MPSKTILRLGSAALAVGTLFALNGTAAHATDGQIRTFKVKVNIGADIDSIYVNETTCYRLPRHTAGWTDVPGFLASNDTYYSNIQAWKGGCESGSAYGQFHGGPPILDKNGAALTYWWVNLGG
jgi:hypothetical protein